MKLKKQFTLLISVSVAIPLIFLFFLLIENYLHSTNRYLIDGYKEIDRMEKEEVENYQDAINIIDDIAPEVQYCLVDTESNEIVSSTIPEIGKIDSMTSLWRALSGSTNQYFYQFTSPATKKATILITRIPRHKPTITPSLKIIYSLIVVFSVTLLICICSIVYISRTIFTSIIKIKNETVEIANGNINKPIRQVQNKKHSDNEILSILESLEKMRESLCESEKRKSNFIMGISHDLRTPVAIMKGYTEAITDGVLTNTDDIKEALGLVESKIGQLEAMINELINFTKLNNFELRETLTLNSITDLINTFAKESQLSANVFKKIVITDIDLPENIEIHFNKQLILRAFENLFSNALRYTNDGDVITIKSHVLESGEIALSVSDTGVGINPNDLPHIFDLFYKQSGSRESGQSMGIGLAVVKNVLDTHGWDIDVESELGKGTCFTIYIPTVEEEE